MTLALASPRAAEAQTGSPRERARALLREGNALRAKGDLAGAAARYREAHALFPSFKIDLNLATTLFELGRYPGAATHFQRFFRQGAGQSPARIVEAARRRFMQALQQVGTLRLTGSAPGAAVTVDGEDGGRMPLPGPLYVAPGPHRVAVSLRGETYYGREVTLGAAEELTLEVPAPPPASQPATRPVTRPASRPSLRLATPPITTAPPRRRPWRRTAGWIALGLGAALAAGAASLYATGAHQGEQGYETYSNLGPTDAEASYTDALDEIDAAQGKLIGGHVLAGLTAAAVGVGLYLLLSRDEAPATRTAAWVVGF